MIKWADAQHRPLRIATFFGKPGKRQQPIYIEIFLNLIPLSSKHQQFLNLCKSYLFMNEACGLGSRSDADNSVLEHCSPLPLPSNGPREKPALRPAVLVSMGLCLSLQVTNLDLVLKSSRQRSTVSLSQGSHTAGATRKLQRY